MPESSCREGTPGTHIPPNCCCRTYKCTSPFFLPYDGRRDRLVAASSGAAGEALWAGEKQAEGHAAVVVNRFDLCPRAPDNRLSCTTIQHL